MRERQLIRGLVIRLGAQIRFLFFVSGRVQEIRDTSGRSRRSGFGGWLSHGG